MESPRIMARNSEGDVGPEAPTELSSVVSVPFEINGPGEIKVSVFSSVDSGGNGGFILRIEMDKQDSGFQPVAIDKAGCVEIHVAGSIESGQTIRALKAALATL